LELGDKNSVIVAHAKPNHDMRDGATTNSLRGPH